MKIDIEETTYKRLEALVQGFETPDSVINRLIDSVEGKKETKPELSFTPIDESRFLKLLVRDRVAEVVLYKQNGERTVSQWSANKITESSNLRANLWSGFLRGWKEKGIISAEFNIYPSPSTYEERQEFEWSKAIALKLGLTFDEMQQLEGDYEVDENSSEDGLVYDHVIRFYDNCDREILDKINGLDEYNQVRVML